MRRAGDSRTSKSFTGAADDAHAVIAEQQRLLGERLAALKSDPPPCAGRGIVTAIGSGHIPGGWVLLTLLRHVHHCRLPVEIWYLGDDDLPPAVRALFDQVEVEFVDAVRDPRIRGPRPATGWELKANAIAYSRFAEVLWLDADLEPLRDLAKLFDDARYQSTGALFWPDIRRVNRFNPIWAIAGTTAPDGPEWESGIILVDKRRHWPELQLALHFNQQSNFYYRYLIGDKDTFQLAWRLRDASRTLPLDQPELIFGLYPDHATGDPKRVGLWQHDFAGERIALHRTDIRLVAWGRNPNVSGFPYVAEHDAALAELRAVWDGTLGQTPVPRLNGAMPTDIERIARFTYIRAGIERRELELLAGGRVGDGAREMECFWRIEDDGERPRLILSSRRGDTCALGLAGDGRWSGNWLQNEQCPVELIPQARATSPHPNRADALPTLLYITPVAPAETGNGVAMRAAQVLRMLTETHRVSVLILPLYHNVAAAEPPNRIFERCAAVRWAERPHSSDDTHVASEDAAAWQEAWINEIGRVYDGESFDTIHLFRTSTMTLARDYLERPTLHRATRQLDLDDVESRTQTRIAALHALYGDEVESAEAERRANLALRIEQLLLTTWDRLFVCSELDQDALAVRMPSRRAEIVIIPNRVHLPTITSGPPRRPPLTLLYVGTLSYFPNADGLRWFCREVLPRIREWRALDIRLLVVGSGATDAVRDLAHIPEVEIVGEVARLDEWYARADLVIAPLRAGGGTRIKLIEALAYERPVVGTTLAAEGLDVCDGTHLLLGDRPAVFARHCLTLLEDHDLAARLAANGRALVEERYAVTNDESHLARHP